MRTGKNQKRLLTLAISLALAGSVGYANLHNTVNIHDENTGKMDVIIVPNGTQDQTGTGINAEYNSNSGSGTYEITAIHFSNVNNYSLSVAQGDISAGRAPGSNSGDIKFTGLLWEGGTGNKLTLNEGIYTANASRTINTGSAAYLNYATLKNYSGTVTINGALSGTAIGAAGTSQAGGSAQANGLDIDGSTISIDGTAPEVSSTATGGNGMDTNETDDARGNGGSADTTSMALNSSSISGTLEAVRAEATGGNGGLNQNKDTEASGKAIWGSGGAATATSLAIQTRAFLKSRKS